MFKYKPNFKKGFLDLGLTFSKSSGGGTSVPMSKELMRFQSDQWRGNTQWFNENGYKFLRQGLINADYNPILAIGAQPLNGAMPSATATEPTNSFSYDGAAGMQANTARKISDSQISVNKATASKLAEEALTQANVRNNLDSQSVLNLLQSEEIQRLLPLKEQRMLAEIAVADSVVNMNNTTTAYIPYNSDSTRISANAAMKGSEAAMKNAEVNEQWSPAKLLLPALGAISGLGGFGLLSKGKNLWKAYKTANQIKKYKKLGNSTSYYKEFIGTTVH